MVDRRARRRNPPRPKQRLEPEHHTGRVLDQIPIRPGELLQRRAIGAPMIDCAQRPAAQLLGEVVGIDLIPLIALARRPASIADNHPIHERRQQLVQPLRLGAFLERDMPSPAHPADELRQGAAVSRQHASRNHPPAHLPHRRHRSCLVHVERDILRCPFHESRSLLRTTGLGRLYGSSRGSALNMR